MIPAIAFMIGAYIITRMINLILDSEELSIVTTIPSSITILITIFCIYIVLSAGFEVSNLPFR